MIKYDVRKLCLGKKTHWKFMGFNKGVYEKFTDTCVGSGVQLTCFGMIIMVMMINNKESLWLSKKSVKYPSFSYNFHPNNIPQQTESRGG